MRETEDSGPPNPDEHPNLASPRHCGMKASASPPAEGSVLKMWPWD